MESCPRCDRNDLASERALKIHITQRHEQGESKEDIINSIQEVAEELGRTPTKEDFDEHGSCTSPIVADRFGSWGKGVKEAGLTPIRDCTGYTTECAYCGDELTLPKWELDRYDQHFCRDDSEWSGFSRCYAEYRSEELSGEDSWAYKGGPIRYGSEWREARDEAFDDDDGVCQMCGTTDEEYRDEHGFGIDVHRRHRVRDFDTAEEAHTSSELITLCRACHKFWEFLPIQPIGKRWDRDNSLSDPRMSG